MGVRIHLCRSNETELFPMADVAVATPVDTRYVSSSLWHRPAPSRGYRLLVAVILTIPLCLIAQPVWAHGGSTSAPQAVTVDLGEVQVGVVVDAVSRVPGPVLVDLSIARPFDEPLTVEVRAWSSHESRPTAAEAMVHLLAGDAGPYPTQIEVDDIGPWEIELRLPDSAGPVSTARIPITVTLPPDDPAQPTRSIAYATAGAIAVAGTATAILSRRRSDRICNLAVRSTVPATVAALAVAVTLSISPPAPAVTTDSTMQGALPHVNVGVHPIDGTPVAGSPSMLEFVLTDGSTGMPVDDIAPHHEALLHVAIMGHSPLDFAHSHPARVAPGRYLLRWTPLGAGTHDVQIELVRGVATGTVDASTQVIERSIKVGAGNNGQPSPLADVEGLGIRSPDGLDIEITATGPLVVGTPIGFNVDVTSGGSPVEITPWLGMEGHMMLRNREAQLFTHLHAVGPMSTTPTLSGVRVYEGDPLLDEARSRQREASVGASSGETDGAPDSSIDFAYTFPVEGRYTAWVQFRHDDEIVTVPMSIEVVR